MLPAGGPPAELTITVRNTGTGPSTPVTTSLALPDGVSAALPSARSGGRAATTPQSADGMTCRGGTGEVSCTTTGGIGPGEAREFAFPLRAAPTATGGEITARVSAGSAIHLRLPAMPVVVEPVDGVRVELARWSWDPDDWDLDDLHPNHRHLDHRHPDHRPSAHRHDEDWDDDWDGWGAGWVGVEVTNTGSGGGLAEAVARLPEGVEAIGVSPACRVLPADDEIRCAAELDPGESFTGALLVHSDGGWSEVPERLLLPVTATLGSATDEAVIDLLPDCAPVCRPGG
ncbi:hypothetical protein [Saccharopolyspora sp. CA-218241]|uniref:hypothetical protein n=1 Tax=Saccharopolyspora sp. CA-218241 TaxID=3240027 RepID=UPI003D979340